MLATTPYPTQAYYFKQPLVTLDGAYYCWGTKRLYDVRSKGRLVNKGVEESVWEDDGRGVVVVRRSGVASLRSPPSRCALMSKAREETQESQLRANEPVLTKRRIHGEMSCGVPYYYAYFSAAWSSRPLRLRHSVLHRDARRLSFCSQGSWQAEFV